MFIISSISISYSQFVELLNRALTAYTSLITHSCIDIVFICLYDIIAI